jgi:two-component system nitrogen regulation response regulator GlnG
MPRILIIDDDDDFREYLQARLRAGGHDVLGASLAEQGLDLLVSDGTFDLVLLDNRMPRISGLEFLVTARDRGVRTPVVLMTGVHSDRTAIQAAILEAFDYIVKPLSSDDLLRELQPILRRAMEIMRRPPPVPLPSPDGPVDDTSAILGSSEPMRKVYKAIGQVAVQDVTVLILGETGTGKDLVARALHTNSPRCKQPFVVMNCTALNENLLEDELFGHEENAFTGADKLRKGRFEHAHGGTLFLDEVGDMPLTLQAKLLRVLQNGEVVRIGSNDPIQVDVRVLAATHRDLKALVREGKFRADLFYRLDGRNIQLPPLRERTEDIESLARRFLGQTTRGAARCLHPAALQRLRGHPWPGNIRQLQNVLGRAADVCRGPQILAEDLDFGEPEPTATPPALSAAEADAALRRAVAWAWQAEQSDVWPRLQQALERELLRHALAQPGISQVQLARRLGMARNTLRQRLRQYGLEEPVEGEG